MNSDDASEGATKQTLLSKPPPLREEGAGVSSSAGHASNEKATIGERDERNEIEGGGGGGGGEEDTATAAAKKDWRFWIIIISLSTTILLAALESTVVSTALTTIAGDLQAGDKYVWFINTWFLTSACFQPLYGQAADIFGRRWLTNGAVATILLGSGISGGAKNAAMMIAGRALQGIGGGGINVMLEIIISDILPLRERGKYMGIVFAVFSIGTTLRPVVGGLIATNVSWRWVFYINLPLGGFALVLLILFLKVNYRRASWQEKMERIDYVGNALLVPSTVSVLIALSWGGTQYAWSDYHTLIPLLVGFAGTAVFHMGEGTRWCKNPVVPPSSFANRT